MSFKKLLVVIAMLAASLTGCGQQSHKARNASNIQALDTTFAQGCWSETKDTNGHRIETLTCYDANMKDWYSGQTSDSYLKSLDQHRIDLEFAARTRVLNEDEYQEFVQGGWKMLQPLCPNICSYDEDKYKNDFLYDLQVQAALVAERAAELGERTYARKKSNSPVDLPPAR